MEDSEIFPALDNLVRRLSSLPGIGGRSALRIAFHLLRVEAEEARELGRAIEAVRAEIRFCVRCGGLADRELCDICSDDRRNPELLCVVEEPGDIYAIEKTGEFDGVYHVLNGALSPLDGIGPDQLRIRELDARLREQAVQEIFIATNPTLEGDATAQYIGDRLADRGIRVTRISHGLPTGTTIEFADRSALARSIRSRQDL